MYPKVPCIYILTSMLYLGRVHIVCVCMHKVHVYLSVSVSTVCTYTSSCTYVCTYVISPIVRIHSLYFLPKGDMNNMYPG